MIWSVVGEAFFLEYSASTSDMDCKGEREGIACPLTVAIDA